MAKCGTHSNVVWPSSLDVTLSNPLEKPGYSYPCIHEKIVSQSFEGSCGCLYCSKLNTEAKLPTNVSL